MSTTKCPNCGKEIESFKMVLHERFCSLNVRKCSVCDEPVQIDEYAEHKNLKHTELSCEKCGKKFPAAHFNSHLKSCSKKMTECQYCGLFMDQNELKEHEYQCGSKTKQCEYCGMNVPIMEFDLHLEYTCKIKQQFDNPNPNPNPDNNNNNNNNNINNINNIENHNNSNNIDKDYLKDLDNIEKNVFNGKKPRKKRNKWIYTTNNEKKDIIKYPDFNNNININSKKKQFNYMDKFAGDFINNSDEINYLNFDDDDVNKIPNSGDKDNINSDNNKDNKENNILFNNNDNEIIDDIISGRNKNKNKRNKTKEKDGQTKNKNQDKTKNKDKSKNKKKEDKKDKKKNKRKNSSSSSISDSNSSSSSSEDKAIKKREKIKSNDKKKKKQ